MKHCKKCDSTKELAQFSRHSGTKDGLSYCCKECRSKQRAGKQSDYKREYSQKNPEKVKAYALWFKYRLTVDEYEIMIANGCDVCGSLDNPCVDHDHLCCEGKRSCGKCIRGILCVNCNKAEGFLRSDPQLARKMAVYLEGRR